MKLGNLHFLIEWFRSAAAEEHASGIVRFRSAVQRNRSQARGCGCRSWCGVVDGSEQKCRLCRKIRYLFKVCRQPEVELDKEEYIVVKQNDIS